MPRERPGLFTIDVNVRLIGIDEITDLLREILASQHRHRHPHLTGGKLVIIVKDTQPEVGYSISGVTAQDAEGHTIPDAKLTYKVESTDSDVVSVTPDPDDQTKGTASFGAPGVATVNVLVEAPDGTLLGSFAAPFTVTEGDPASISGGSISFDGLTDQP